MSGRRGRTLGRPILFRLLLAGTLEGASAQAKPEGEMRWALYVTLSPLWFDPGEVAGWIVPKKYVERVGDDGFRRAPVGLGPYKLVSNNPGIELVMEANEGYWRKVSSVKRDPNLKLVFSGGIAIWFLDFLDQWDPKSPWHDRRVRLAANYAIDRQALSDAETLGASKPAGSHVPRTFEFALPIEPYPYDPAKAKQLLAEAGYPNGFDAGELHQLPPYFSMGEAIVQYMQCRRSGSGSRCGRWSAELTCL